ncbi:MAG: phenylalanine--tRNA ligase subunit beta [Candidatus Omnitrophica bacterium]|nr:phenylalanine--tRNA ligase subunit beta [Candidatus Omnitrophota bacterium]
MKIPLLWLREYTDFSDDAQTLADKLTMTGTAIEAVEGNGDLAVLHAELTTNRPDCLSLLGIAKEVAAICGGPVKFPEISSENKPEKSLPIEIEIKDSKGCPAYTAICFADAKIQKTPGWMTEKLALIGQSSVNNVVDITNYCLFENGQPLHAFDYDKIKGKKIIVRKAVKGESIVGINNIKYELDPEILVIADAERPIAIAGVMGGKDTEITESTKNILLESAAFNASTVRSVARKLKITTDSSHRFERYVDPNLIIRTSRRAGRMILELASAVTASELIVKGEAACSQVREVKLKQQTLNRVLGEKSDLKQAAGILKKIDIQVKDLSETELTAVAGSERPDIEIEADLVEEIIRLKGFENIPTHIPTTKHVYDAYVERSDSEYRNTLSLKKSLAAQGFWETVTFSLVSGEALQKVNYPESAGKIRIANPISKEQEWLRPTHLPVLLDVIAHNLNRQEKNLKLFDIGSRFKDGSEEQVLALAITGYSDYSWEVKKEASFAYLKGIAENVFTVLGKPSGSWSEAAFEFKADDYTSVIADGRGRVIASVSKVCDKVLAKWKIVQPVYYAQISLGLVFGLPDRKKQFTELSKSPSVSRDIAFLIDRKITVNEIEKVIQKSAGSDLSSLTLFDLYQGKGIPKEKRSLAFNLQYQKQNKTYTDDEIVKLQDKVLKSLEENFSIELRK